MQFLKPVLLVEDDDLDAMIVQRCIETLGIKNQLIRKDDPIEAMAYLRSLSTREPLPCVILLDLNMPRMNGFEFLLNLKTDLTLVEIPVFMVTTSIAQADINTSMELGAVGYIPKSPCYQTFLESMTILQSYCDLSDSIQNLTAHH